MDFLSQQRGVNSFLFSTRSMFRPCPASQCILKLFATVGITFFLVLDLHLAMHREEINFFSFQIESLTRNFVSCIHLSLEAANSITSCQAYSLGRPGGARNFGGALQGPRTDEEQSSHKAISPVVVGSNVSHIVDLILTL